MSVTGYSVSRGTQVAENTVVKDSPVKTSKTRGVMKRLESIMIVFKEICSMIRRVKLVSDG